MMRLNCIKHYGDLHVRIYRRDYIWRWRQEIQAKKAKRPEART